MDKTRILVAESEQDVADDIRGKLENLGYAISGVVHSGEEALKKVEEVQPDLILMNIILEGNMPGIITAVNIRSRFDIPIVYISDYVDKKLMELMKFTEPYGYIVRPVDENVLLTTVEIALQTYNVAKQKPKEEDGNYRSVIESVQDAIFVITPNGLQYVNPAFERLTGYTKEELCDPNFNFWDLIHPHDVELVKKNGEENKEKDEAVRSYEFRIKTKNGRENIVDAHTMNIETKEEEKRIGILRDITARKLAEEKRTQSFEKLRKALEETVYAMASVVEMKDPYVTSHNRRVAELSCAIAEEMGLSTERTEGLRLAARIHDVGKIVQVPAETLSKPGGLADIEVSMIKLHPKFGYDLLKSIEFPYPVAETILQHHERLDGSGYPTGLKDEEILLEAKILGVADVVEAMASSRSFRPSRGINKALEEITEKKGILYDPQVVDTCLKLFYEKGYKLEDSEEEPIPS